MYLETLAQYFPHCYKQDNVSSFIWSRKLSKISMLEWENNERWISNWTFDFYILIYYSWCQNLNYFICYNVNCFPDIAGLPRIPDVNLLSKYYYSHGEEGNGISFVN
jgi:hypothetical protein